jgi:hypothetical protein
MKKEAKVMISETTKIKANNTTALAARSLPRRGTAARLLPIAPVEYSEVISKIPSSPIASWAMTKPDSLIEVGSHVSLLLSALLA